MIVRSILIVGIGKGVLRGGIRGHHAGDILVGDAVGLRRVADDIGGAFGSAQFVVGVQTLRAFFAEPGTVKCPANSLKCYFFL